MRQVTTGPANGATHLAGVRLRVTHDGTVYPAEPVGKGAAYELFVEQPEPGLLRNPRPGALEPYRRFVPACEVEVIEGEIPVPFDGPLYAPLSRMLDWASLQRKSQVPPEPGSELLGEVRRTARIRRGTRMVKVLSAGQLAGYLRGWLPQGFCYREHDIAHLRTPAELATLRSDGGDSSPAADDVGLVLRWRATDPTDYEIPSLANFPGLVGMPPLERVGPPIVGTGFAPSVRHLIPEWVTADLSDLPLPAFAELVAYTADGTEVLLYTYLPEQRAWIRMAGPQWRHLLADVPAITPDQEYFPVPPATTLLVGTYRDEVFEAVADPPGEFRVLAKNRAARYPVQSLARRTPYVRWRRATWTVIRDEGDWLRLRLIRPDSEAVTRTRAKCVERGIYETWAPSDKTGRPTSVDIHYSLDD